MKSLFTPLLLAILLGLSQCKKTDPASKLPPATQTGVGTFGCLVNGQPWTPQGYAGFSNYTVSYDTFPTGGLLEIITLKIYGSGPNDFQSLALWVNRLAGPGTYSFQDKQRAITSFNDQKTTCYWSSADSTTTYRRGSITLTRLDLKAGIVSGTFALTLYKPGCDSVCITQGRFDRKL